MSSSPPPIGFVGVDPGPSDQMNSQQQQQPKEKIKLTWIDKIFRFFYSKTEFEAYLVEKEMKRKG